MKRLISLKTASLILCVTALAICCSAQTSSPDCTTQKLFEFHSGFWINLHHFLYSQALLARPGTASDRLVLSKADQEELGLLSTEEHATWDQAISYYADSLAQRDLLFDREMEAIKNHLENAEGSVHLAGVQVPSDLKAVLLRAAPIYQKHWWTKHDAGNRLWIERVDALVDSYGSSLCSSLVRIYEVPWPDYPVRVDAVAYANWAGAYTTLYPTRPTISTKDTANQGTAALEIVFHETSHGMMNKVRTAIDVSEKAANNQSPNGPIRLPRDLWHAVLFYTSGELVAESVSGYTPYANKNGLWARAWPDPDRLLIARDWTPHMTGSVPLAAALSKLIDDLATVSSGHQ